MLAHLVPSVLRERCLSFVSWPMGVPQQCEAEAEPASGFGGRGSGMLLGEPLLLQRAQPFCLSSCRLGCSAFPLLPLPRGLGSRRRLPLQPRQSLRLSLPMNVLSFPNRPVVFSTLFNISQHC